MPPPASFRNFQAGPIKSLLRRFSPRAEAAFTLMELLVVMAIMAGTMVLIAPAITSFRSRGDFSGALYKIAGTLQEARTYAMANNTHVFVGIEELDAARSASDSPQTPATRSAGGRVAVAAFASRDGTSVYDIYSLNNWAANYGKGAALTPLGKIAVFENLHLADFGTPPSGGNMARPVVPSDYNMSSTECVSATPFTYPPGAALGAGYKYYFSKVITFDPQGTARIVSAKNGDALPNVIEIGIQPTHANTIPAAPADQNTGSHAAIQVNGATGSVKIYQP